MRLDYLGGKELKLGSLLLRDIMVMSAISGVVVVIVAILFIGNMGVDDPATAGEDALTSDEIRNFQIAMVLPLLGSFGMFAWRVVVWSRLLRDGVESPARIIKYDISNEGMTIEVSYRFEGKDIQSSTGINSLIPMSGKKISAGDSATVIIDTKKPTKYLLLDRFLRPVE